MRTACKIILNGGTRGLSEAMEKVLTSPIVRGHMLPESEADSMLNRLSQIDLRACDGQENGELETSGDSLLLVLNDLVKSGAVDPEVWRLYHKPDGVR
jgi:hypothetical protein